MKRPPKIDSQWFYDALDEAGQSLRSVARHMKMDPSLLSRKFRGEVWFKPHEIEAVCNFIRLSSDEALRRAGLMGDMGLVLVTMDHVVDGFGAIAKADEELSLTADLRYRIQGALRVDDTVEMEAAQIRATKGPLLALDDSVAVFARQSGDIDSAAVGALSVLTPQKGERFLAHLTRVRKTGEAVFTTPDGKEGEAQLKAASPVLLIIP